jgi:cellobiose phosphorylase
VKLQRSEKRRIPGLGTAAWNYLAITQWILGIRPEFDGLRIDPCIPPEWDGFSVVRVYRGCRLHISVHNPEHVSRGVRKMELNGQAVDGNLFIVNERAGDWQVDVWMGN